FSPTVSQSCFDITLPPLLAPRIRRRRDPRSVPRLEPAKRHPETDDRAQHDHHEHDRLDGGEMAEEEPETLVPDERRDPPSSEHAERTAHPAANAREHDRRVPRQASPEPESGPRKDEHVDPLPGEPDTQAKPGEPAGRGSGQNQEYLLQWDSPGSASAS